MKRLQQGGEGVWQMLTIADKGGRGLDIFDKCHVKKWFCLNSKDHRKGALGNWGEGGSKS